MITSQPTAVWELCRQGFPSSAEEAERLWRSGATYRPPCYGRLPRTLRHLIDQCNHEVSIEVGLGRRFEASA